MKKILTTLSAFVLTLTCMFCFAGCGGGATQIVSVSMNPDVLFGVNGDKITSVTYKNEEAERIFSMVDFKGKSLEEATTLFLEMSLISGHITFGSQQITIEAIGSNAEQDTALLNSLKADFEETIDNLGLTTITVAVNDETNIDEKKRLLQGFASEYNMDKTYDELVKMNHKDLIACFENGANKFKDVTLEQMEALKVELYDYFDEIGAETVYEAFEQAKALLEELTENAPNNIKQALQAELREAEQALNQVLNQVKQEQNRLLNLAKQAAAEAKETIKTAFKAEVAEYKASVTSHLDEKLADGDITQEYYDHLVALMNQYSPAA